MVTAFLSYAHEDRKLAGNIKSALDDYGFEVFLAHEDLQPSVEWQEVILQQLTKCMVFLPLLTEAFTKSDWTDQETGAAVSLKKIIVPMKLTLDPYGFIGRYQAQSFVGAADKTSVFVPVVKEACWSILKTLASNRRIGSEVKNGIIAAFGRSGTFKEASRNAEKLQSLEPFSDKQLNEIVRLSIANDQISHGFDARAYVNDLIRRNDALVDGSLVRTFLKAQK